MDTADPARSLTRIAGAPGTGVRNTGAPARVNSPLPIGTGSADAVDGMANNMSAAAPATATARPRGRRQRSAQKQGCGAPRHGYGPPPPGHLFVQVIPWIAVSLTVRASA